MARTPDPHRDQRWAWGFVVLIVAGAVLSQFLGYGLAMLLGYDVPEEASPPLGAALLIVIPALIVAIAPGCAALFFGIRAGLGGRFGGYVAAAVGGLSVVYWVVVSFISLLVRP